MLQNIKNFFQRINAFFKDLVTLKFEGYDYASLEEELNNIKKEFGDLFDTLLNKDGIMNKEEFKEIVDKYDSLGVSLEKINNKKVSNEYLAKLEKEIIIKFILNLLICSIAILLNLPLGIFFTYLNYLFINANGEIWGKEDAKMNNYLNYAINVANKLGILNGNIERLMQKNEKILKDNESISISLDTERQKEQDKCLVRQRTR